MAIPIYFGVKLCGWRHQADGTSVATQFFHLYHLPLVPVASHHIAGGQAQKIALNGASVALTYVQYWGLQVAGLLAVFGINALTNNGELGTGGVLVTLATLVLWATVASWFLPTRRRGEPLSSNAKVAFPLLLAIPTLALGYLTWDGMQHARRISAARSDSPLADLFARAMADAARSATEPRESHPVRMSRLCDGGDMSSCTTGGIAYYDGSGVPKDEARGLVLLNKACDGKEPIACSWMGKKWYAASDFTRAAAAFERACKLRGYTAADSCYRLADMYAGGIGVPKSAAMATKYRRAAGR